jgi:hypothetical protein
MLLCGNTHFDQIAFIGRLRLRLSFFLSSLSVAASEQQHTAKRQNKEALHG